MVLSPLPEATNVLSKLIATDLTASLWPDNVLISYPFKKFQILTVLSPLPDTMYFLSELIATENTESL